jgi:ankyrin repeat protein
MILDFPLEIFHRVLDHLYPEEILCVLRAVPCLAERLAIRHVSQRNDLEEKILHLLAESGEVELMESILSHSDVDPNCEDNDYQTPISRAINNGNEAVIRLLLPCERFNPNHSWPPLSEAIEFGLENVAEMLLSHPDTDPNAEDTYGCTPLAYAVTSGCPGIVKRLLEKGATAANISTWNWIQILKPERKRELEAVSLLLREENVPACWPSICDGSALLSRAADLGVEDLVRLLLARDDIYADSRADCGRTPLGWASISEHEVIVKLLLARDEVKRDTRDIQHALELAEDWHHEGVAKLLREGHVD